MMIQEFAVSLEQVDNIKQNTPTLFRAKGKILHTKKEYYYKPKELAFRKRKSEKPL